jgi:hypothetical protein
MPSRTHYFTSLPHLHPVATQRPEDAEQSHLAEYIGYAIALTFYVLAFSTVENNAQNPYSKEFKCSNWVHGLLMPLAMDFPLGYNLRKNLENTRSVKREISRRIHVSLFCELGNPR